MSVTGEVNVDGSCNDCGGGGGGGWLTTTVSIVDNAATPASITALSNTGTYMIMVNAVLANGASADFNISKGNSAVAGNVFRTSNSPAITNERIDILWPIGGPPQLYHSTLKTGGTGALLVYNVKYVDGV